MAYRRTERVMQRLAARQEAILAAARAIAAELGMAAVQIAPVAARAGIAAGTVYRYYPAKTDLVAALVASVSESEIVALRRAADAAPGPLALRTSIAAAAAAVGYFALQRAAEALTAGILPPAPTPGALEWVLIVIAVLGFGLTAFAQATFPLWAQHPAAAGLRVHLANGLYVNALTDRLLRGWSLRNAA